MKIFTANETVRVGAGVVALTAEQAKPRLHNLEATGASSGDRSEYRVTQPVEFKRGEVFGWDGEFPKGSAAAEPVQAAPELVQEPVSEPDGAEDGAEGDGTEGADEAPTGTRRKRRR